jgi:hypothetical protein
VRFAGAGHMPHDDEPERFARTLADFYAETEAAQLTHDHWQPVVR